MSDKAVSTLSDLEAFDPQSRPRKEERRFLCPLCGEVRPRDEAHRSLPVCVAKGLWNCKRCMVKGRLREHWTARPEPANPALQRQQVAFSIGASPAASNSPTKNALAVESKAVGEIAEPSLEESQSEKWRTVWNEAQELGQGRACKYLQARGIDIEVALASQVRFAERWHRRPTIAFPFCDNMGEVVAIAGLCLSDGGVDKPSLGPKKEGAFRAFAGGFSPFDTRAPVILVCEAPLDALSVATDGFPALAFGGTSAPHWLKKKCAFRDVALALDADAAGDKASENLSLVLSSFGSRCSRLRPEGAKDWNEMLLKRGRDDFRDWQVWKTLAD